MMNMKNYMVLTSRIARTAKVLLCGCLVAMTCSCEDFLSTTPTDKIVSEDFWKTKGDVENVAAESYRLMAQWDFLSRVLVWGELRGDNVIEGDYGGDNDIMNIIDANLLPTNGYASWAPFYKVINNCNIVLKYAEGVLDEDPDFTLGDYNVIRGEMYAIRAFCHFYLVRTFRDVPLLTEAVVDNTQELYHRQVDPIVVLDSCLNDLSLAEDLVLTTGNYTSNMLANRGRFTKDAVRTMRADVLLWKAAFLTQRAGGDNSVAQAQECYDECIEYCEMVLNSRMQYIEANKDKETNLKAWLKDVVIRDKEVEFPIVFAKETDLQLSGNKRLNHKPYLQHFASANYALCEGIFEIQHTINEDDGNYEVPFFYGYADAQNKFRVGKLSASKHLVTVDKLYKRTDFRRVTYLSSEQASTNIDNYPIVKYGYSAATENRGALQQTENDMKKFGSVTYTFWKNKSGSGGRTYFSDAQVNWGVYRIPDVMLMEAEALVLRNNGNGDLDRAFQLVDAIYGRSQAGYKYGENKSFGETSTADRLARANYNNQEQMYNLVMEERQREFAFEGKRWYDLVRMALRENSTDGILGIIQKAGNNTETFDEYRMKMSTLNSLFFPIAEREINVSNNTLVQNPAYETEDLYEKN